MSSILSADELSWRPSAEYAKRASVAIKLAQTQTESYEASAPRQLSQAEVVGTFVTNLRRHLGPYSASDTHANTGRKILTDTSNWIGVAQPAFGRFRESLEALVQASLLFGLDRESSRKFVEVGLGAAEKQLKALSVFVRFAEGLADNAQSIVEESLK